MTDCWPFAHPQKVLILAEKLVSVLLMFLSPAVASGMLEA